MTVVDDDEAFATAELQVRYFRLLREGDGDVRVDAVVLHRGRTAAHVEATFTRSDGDIVAKASATQVIRRVTGD